MINLTLRNWIRIGLGAVALAMVTFGNYDVAVAIGIVMAVYRVVISEQVEKTKIAENEATMFKNMYNQKNYELEKMIKKR